MHPLLTYELLQGQRNEEGEDNPDDLQETTDDNVLLADLEHQPDRLILEPVSGLQILGLKPPNVR